MVKDGADNNFLLRFSGSNANEQELRIPSLVNPAGWIWNVVFFRNFALVFESWLFLTRHPTKPQWKIHFNLG